MNMFQKATDNKMDQNKASQAKNKKVKENTFTKESILERYNPIRVFPNNLMAARFWFYVTVNK